MSFGGDQVFFSEQGFNDNQAENPQLNLNIKAKFTHFIKVLLA
jgi:hypothetical protein